MKFRIGRRSNVELNVGHQAKPSFIFAVLPNDVNGRRIGKNFYSQQFQRGCVRTCPNMSNITVDPYAAY